MEDTLSQLTKGVVREKQISEPDKVKYTLGHTTAREIVKIEGTLNGALHTFQNDADYRLDDGMVKWIEGGDRPDERTAFYISYIFGEPSGITDINPGSVVRTLVESISREIEYLHAQLDAVYRSAFIDTASGSALDLVVSLLGVTRKPPQHAYGKVTFGRNNDPPDVPVEEETLIYDGRNRYDLKNTPVKSINSVQATLAGESVVFEPNIDYRLIGKSIEWLSDGRKPEEGTDFRVNYTAYGRIVVPMGTKVSTFSRDPTKVKTFITTEEKILQKTTDGRWAAIIPVQAELPGATGNVMPGAITIMPQPPKDIEYVINKEEITTGVEAEQDDELRQRAKRALEVVGRATLPSLETAIRGIEGVKTVMIEESPDNVPGIVEVVVDGGNEEEIKRVISETKAAGIMVELVRPSTVFLDITVEVTLERKVHAEEAKESIENRIREYVNSLTIGEDVIFSRMMRATLDFEGVSDVNSLRIDAYRREGTSVSSEHKNITIRENERAEVRTVTVKVEGAR